MSIPLDVLIDKEHNVYETTCVAISLSNVLASQESEEGEATDEKIVSTVINQVLTQEIEFTTEDKE
ncbi:MAG: hypothetical protein WC224_06395 [Sphaerochaetaceae bacterium]